MEVEGISSASVFMVTLPDQHPERAEREEPPACSFVVSFAPSFASESNSKTKLDSFSALLEGSFLLLISLLVYLDVRLYSSSAGLTVCGAEDLRLC